MKVTQRCIFTLLGFLGLALTTVAAEPLPAGLKNVGITEKIGSSIPLNATFKDEQGQPVRLGHYFATGRPVILNLVYFNCPMLCNLVLDGFIDGLKGLPRLDYGKDVEIITVSIDPNDTPKAAQEFKQKYMSLLKNPKGADHWHFLVGAPNELIQLSRSVGFNYAYNPTTKQFAHAAALFVLTPEAKVARYLYGTEYKPFNIKMALLEAKQNKMISSVERVLLFCYNYDAHEGGYVLYAMRIMRLGAGITVGLLAVFLIRLSRKTKQQPPIPPTDEESVQ